MPAPNQSRFTLAALGILAILGVSAAPMLPAFLSNPCADLPVNDVRQRPGDAICDSFSHTIVGPNDFHLLGHNTREGDAPLVVDVKDNATDADIAALNARYGLKLRYNSPHSVDDKLMLSDVSASVSGEILHDLRRDPLVEAAEWEQIVTIPPTMHDGGTVQVSRSNPPAAIVWGEHGPGALSTRPNDPRYDEQWNFQAIGVERAWERTRGKGVIVAVIDTGVAGGDVKKGKPCRDFNKTHFVKGYNFVGDNADAYDDHGHGTHVAGTIAESTNNNEGVTGIAFEASIMPLKVLSAQGSGTVADIADAIRYAADKGAHVINMSLGSNMSSDVMHKACQYAAKKGVVIVCAAGNSFGGKVGFPAAYPECIAVSAVGPSGDIAKYSSYGKQVALAAPGGDMIDSQNPADGILQNTVYEGTDAYYAFQGTSMASPHVAGVAALIIGQGETDAKRVRDILTKTATPKNDKNKYGAGVLNAANATAKGEAVRAVKLRHLLILPLALLLCFAGPRRRAGLRVAMGGALMAGFFGPDLFSRWVGADSAWNLLGYSALAPLAAYALLRRGPGVKVAGMLGLGVGVCLYAGWHNDTLPFTFTTFGSTPLLWTLMNGATALGVGIVSAAKAYHATNR